MEPQSVEAVCNLLGRSRLLNPDQIRALHQRWRAEAKNADDVAAFGQWLVAREYLTEFQAGLVLRGRVDHFFFGPYKILERVGKGRMAGVYSAVHALGQPVAIKVLPPSKSKVPELLARFQREARLAMKLKHPNVVRTFQTGQNDDLNYIVMEYLDGETLEDVLKRRGKLPPAEAARLAHQALLGLQHLHEQGMIHRDIKPGNLMLLGGTPASTMTATVKLMDIGLGKALFDEGAPAPPPGGRFELTNEGSLLGTPDYMAPEQARNATSTDIRADIYSLGCVLYHSLAGQVPFPETNLVRQLMRHASEAARPLREFSPAVPEGLQQIVEWMMAKDPGNRYPTPERAAQALQMFLAAGGSAGTTQPEGRMRAYLDWLDKQPGAAAAAAVPTVAPVPEIELVPVEEQPKRAAPRKRKPEPAAPPRKQRPARADADEDAPKTPRILSRRDLMLLGLGGGAVVGGLVLVGAMAWLLNRWLRPKAEESPPATEPAAPPTDPE